MHSFSRISLALAALPLIVSSTVLDLYKRDVGLEVTLEHVENAVVKATVKNVGAENLNLFAYGSLLDKAPVQKLHVFEADTAVPFQGIHRSVQRTNLAPETFVLLAAGASYETTVNAAEVHDLATSTYSFTAEGAIPFATSANSTELSGQALYFKSNTLTIPVDGEAVKSVAKAVSKRTVLQSDCTGSKKSATVAALAECKTLANAASTAASSGSSTKFSEYFKTTSTSVRSTVAARLAAVATQCGSTTSGGTKYYCTDTYNYCESNVLAYTLPSTNEIVNCPLYFSDLPALTSTCHAQDQATTTLHEMTHAPATYSPGTADNGYGYAAATALTSAKAVLNADSYALYANAIYVGC